MCVSLGFKYKIKLPRNEMKVFVASVFSEASIVIVMSDVRSLSPFPLEKETCFFEKFA